MANEQELEDMMRLRVLKDIERFDQAVSHLPSKYDEVREYATRYRKDAAYFLEKGDIFTAWCSICYAHGLIDGARVHEGDDLL